MVQVRSIPVLRDMRNSALTSRHCESQHGIYDFIHNICTTFEVMASVCVTVAWQLPAGLVQRVDCLDLERDCTAWAQVHECQRNIIYAT